MTSHENQELTLLFINNSEFNLKKLFDFHTYTAISDECEGGFQNCNKLRSVCFKKISNFTRALCTGIYVLTC